MRPAAAAAGLLLALAAPAAALTAAAGKVDVTPDLRAERTYLAGYGSKGRVPTGIHDRLYARLLVVSDGTTTVALASFDWLGVYHKDTLELRRLSGFDAPGRYLLVAATHNHSGPDTLGLWGPMVGVSGVNERYHARAKRLVAQKLKELAARLEPARLRAAETRLDPRGLCTDSRDPMAIMPHLAAMAVERPDGRRLATLVNWSCHPEVLDRTNRLLTADFPGPLCARVEKATGGDCLFLTGAVGGLMTPDIENADFYETQRIGHAVADAALASLKSAKQSVSSRIAAVHESPLVPIENSRYLLFLPALTFGHDLLDAEGRALARWKKWWLPLRHAIRRLPPQARPWVRTEVSVVDIGPVRALGIPGEIFPELLIGGYRGEHRYGRPLLTPGNPDPPDLSEAPAGPYLLDAVKAPVRLVLGLANDELGYIVPEYDFKTRGNLTMLPRLPGHHYEETNSIGPSATTILLESARRLLEQSDRRVTAGPR